MTTKIEWCDMVFNPVWGCRNKCPYCYARKFAKRFKDEMFMNECNYYQRIDESMETYKIWTNGKDSQELFENLQVFKPTWIEYQFQKKLPNKPKRIFIGSMSEIFYWKPEWMERVLDKIKEYPQHTFMFLTKHSGVYYKYKFPQNCWLGVTATKEKYIRIAIHNLKDLRNNNIKYISIEPIQDDFSHYIFEDSNINWIIIGMETGNRKGYKYKPGNYDYKQIEMVRNNFKISIFLKDNLKSVWGENLIQEWPNEA